MNHDIHILTRYIS